MNAIDPDIPAQLAADLPRDDVVRILRTFEEDLGRLARELSAAAGAGEAEAYRRAAHSLAGAAAAVGAKRLEQAARIAMDRRDATEPRLLAARIAEEAAAALAELSRLADNLSGSG